MAEFVYFYMKHDYLYICGDWIRNKKKRQCGGVEYAQDRIRECKSNSFPGSLQQELKSVHA